MKFGSINVFNEIYKTSYWGNGSGDGSELKYCIPYINFLQKFFNDFNVKTIVDLGCGDWQFSKEINFKGKKYLGMDVAEEVIKTNNKLFSSKDIKFSLLEKYQDIPDSDLLLCKDIMQHLSIHENKKIIKEVFPKFKYIISTNCVSPRSIFGDFLYKALGKYEMKKINRDILNGDFTLFNITKHPYNQKAQKVLRFKGKNFELKHLIRNPNLLITGYLHTFVKETYLIIN